VKLSPKDHALICLCSLFNTERLTDQMIYRPLAYL